MTKLYAFVYTFCTKISCQNTIIFTFSYFLAINKRTSLILHEIYANSAKNLLTAKQVIASTIPVFSSTKLS